MPSAKLEYGEHPPLFFGVYPLTVGVQIICAFHFLACIAVIAGASSVVTLRVFSNEVSPLLQVLLSAWHILGISVIVGAVISCSTRNEFPMRVYFYYLLITDLVWAAFTVSIAIQGSSCALVSENRSTQRIGLSFSCEMVSAIWFFGLLTVSVIVAYCCWSVYHLKEHLASKDAAQNLLHHEDEEVKSIRAGHHLGLGQHRNPYEDFDEQKHSRNHQEEAYNTFKNPSAWIMPRPGQQANWGALKIRMART